MDGACLFHQQWQLNDMHPMACLQETCIWKGPFDHGVLKAAKNTKKGLGIHWWQFCSVNCAKVPHVQGRPATIICSMGLKCLGHASISDLICLHGVVLTLLDNSRWSANESLTFSCRKGEVRSTIPLYGYVMICVWCPGSSYRKNQ